MADIIDRRGGAKQLQADPTVIPAIVRERDALRVQARLLATFGDKVGLLLSSSLVAYVDTTNAQIADLLAQIAELEQRLAATTPTPEDEEAQLYAYI